MAPPGGDHQGQSGFWTVPVHPDDTVTTLAGRVFAAECELYPVAIRHYVQAHPDLFGDRCI